MREAHDLAADLIHAGGATLPDPAQVAAFLTDALEVAPPARLFEQHPYVGGVTVALAGAGHRVVALAARGRPRQRLQAAVAAAGVEDRVELSSGDAREVAASPPCDGAFNLWNGFGQHHTDAANALILSRAWASLRPGARFVLDTVNPGYVMSHLRAAVVHEREVAGERLSVRCLSRYDPETGVLLESWTATTASGWTSITAAARRLYLPHTLAEMMEAAGFVSLRALGDMDGRPFAPDSPRCIWVGRRQP